MIKSNKTLHTFTYADSSVRSIFTTLSQMISNEEIQFIYFFFFSFSPRWLNDVLTKDDNVSSSTRYLSTLVRYYTSSYYPLIDPWMYTSFITCKWNIFTSTDRFTNDRWRVWENKKKSRKLKWKKEEKKTRRKNFSRKIIIARIIRCDKNYVLLQKYCKL